MNYIKCILYLSSVFLSAVAQQKNIIMEIPNGKLMGSEFTTVTNITAYCFRGIPYAEPPVGNLRFKPPVAAQNWTGGYNATIERSVCTQLANFTPIGSEDCLFLNVFTPQLPSNKTGNPKLPCILYIHGGAFLENSGDIGLHGADRFLSYDVIIVTVNYRLGVFGFLCTQDDASPGNYGLKDQILSLKWIQDNIAYFGGDPGNVTILGESSGAASVLYLVQSPQTEGLFSKAIAESGSTLNPWAVAPNPRTLAFRIGLLNGIWTANSETLIEKLQGIDNYKLISSTVAPTLLDLWDPLNGLPYSPYPEDESPGAAVTGYSYERLKNGNFNHVPLILGYNSLEARDASTLPWYGYLLLEQYNLFVSKLTPDDMHATTAGDSNAGKKIKSYYFQNSSVQDGVDLVNYVSDDEFVRGIRKHAELYSNYSACYLYEFSFTGGSEHSSFEPEGVSHTEELQFLFLSNASVQHTPAAELTAVRMVEMWTNFAKTGNPTYTLSEAVNVTWPLVNANGDAAVHYLNINVTLVPEINPEEEQMEFWDNLYETYGIPPYNAY